DGVPVTSAVAREMRRRRRRSVLLLLILALFVTTGLVTASALQALTVSVADSDQRAVAAGGGAEFVVPEGWVLEDSFFGSSTTVHTPDTAVSLCLETAEETTEARQIIADLQDAHDWAGEDWITEHSPAGAVVTHQQRPQGAPPSAQACGSGSVALIAVVEPAAESGAGVVVSVLVGSETDIEPYRGEIARVIEGVSAL